MLVTKNSEFTEKSMREIKTTITVLKIFGKTVYVLSLRPK